jgi:hypothetical protein
LHTDAEGSFGVSIYKNLNSKIGWRVMISFSIHIHIKDIVLLEKINKTLGVGKVRKNSETTAIFRVDNIKELSVIINHFNKYPLISYKNSDFLLFKECYNLIETKAHLTLEGLEKIVALKYNLNKWIIASSQSELSDENENNLELFKLFPKVVPIERPINFCAGAIKYS